MYSFFWSHPTQLSVDILCNGEQIGRNHLFLRLFSKAEETKVETPQQGSGALPEGFVKTTSMLGPRAEARVAEL